MVVTGTTRGMDSRCRNELPARPVDQLDQSIAGRDMDSEASRPGRPVTGGTGLWPGNPAGIGEVDSTAAPGRAATRGSIRTGYDSIAVLRRHFLGSTILGCTWCRGSKPDGRRRSRPPRGDRRSGRPPRSSVLDRLGHDPDGLTLIVIIGF